MKKAVIAALAVLTLGAMTTGCIGGKNGFHVTRKVYDWNTHATDSEGVNAVIFFGCCVFPVYGVCAGLVDALVLNTIEFWTEEHPLAATSGMDAEGNMYAITPNADGTGTLTYKGQTYTLTRTGDQVVVSEGVAAK